MSPAPALAVEFRDVDILFAPGAGARKMREALAMLDRGQGRAEIAKATGTVVGVAGASLAVRPGEICVLMGLSGSGKSTLLRAANGLNPATRGKVLVQHEGAAVDVAACDSRVLRKIRRERLAMVFQQFALLPWRTVRDNVAFGLELRGMGGAERRRVVDEQLALVGLSEWANRYASELSGGMQQRVGLARAFATSADVLLMDEPFSALDPLIRGKLQDELLDLQAKVRKTILFVSHDLDEAMKLGNTICILEGGRIVQTGAPEDIVLRPANDYVAEFVRHINPLAVLRASHVMRAVGGLERAEAGVLLDPAGLYEGVLDEAGALVRARHGGMALLPHALARVAADLPLREVVARRRASGHPVLVEQDGRLIGVCDHTDIMSALCGTAAAQHEKPQTEAALLAS
jgi:glycine betaine/proline transport system ATP-binding protein